jgi:hypothetical protein
LRVRAAGLKLFIVCINRTRDIICRFVPGDPCRKNCPPEPVLCQPWLLTGKIPDRQNFFSKYPGMGFPGPWGKNPFSRKIIGAALSCHCFTQRTKPPIIGKDNVLHVTDSPKKRSPQLNPPSLNPLLGKVTGLNACTFNFFLGF